MAREEFWLYVSRAPDQLVGVSNPSWSLNLRLRLTERTNHPWLMGSLLIHIINRWKHGFGDAKIVGRQAICTVSVGCREIQMYVLCVLQLHEVELKYDSI